MQTYPDTTQDLTALLEEAARDGGVRIQRGDGSTFTLAPDVPPVVPAVPRRSPLDIPGIDLGLTADEIVAFVREGRERG